MRLLFLAFAISGWCSIAFARDDPARTLFTNVHVFNGVNAERIENANVLIEGNLITSVTTDPINAAGATVIDGGGRALMPGLIDANVHLSLNMGFITMFFQQPDYIAARTLAEAKNTLMRGFTSVRDTGGQVLGAKKAIDEGYFAGPRI